VEEKNEGFNTQKNGGYEMEHLYGKGEKAWKNYFLTLQVSQLMNDLTRFGDYIQKITGDPKATFESVYETMRYFAERLIECWRWRLPNIGQQPRPRTFQIRLAKL